MAVRHDVAEDESSARPPRHPLSTNSAHGFRANERVRQVLAQFAEERELAGLGDAAIHLILAELRKAGLQDQTEDVFQSALLITWERCCRGTVRTVRHFLLTVSRNEARRVMRKLIRVERNDSKAQAWLNLLAGEAVLPEEPLCDERVLVLKAIHQLSPSRRRLLKLIMVEGLADAQAMAAMGLTPAAFRTAKHRAIRDLRDILQMAVKGGQTAGAPPKREHKTRERQRVESDGREKRGPSAPPYSEYKQARLTPHEEGAHQKDGAREQSETCLQGQVLLDVEYLVGDAELARLHKTKVALGPGSQGFFGLDMVEVVPRQETERRLGIPDPSFASDASPHGQDGHDFSLLERCPEPYRRELLSLLNTAALAHRVLAPEREARH